MLLIINREINLFPLNLFIKHIFQLIKYNDINSAKTESYCNKNNSFKLSSTFSSRSLSLGGFTPSKTEQPLQGMELQEKATQKD